MKHWSELMELESAIIRVGEFKNLFKLLVAGSENGVDIKVLQSAIYTMEGMIDDIDSTLYEKFQTIFDAVRDEDTETEGGEEEFEFNFSTMNDNTLYDGHRHADVNAYSTVAVPDSEYQGSTVQINSDSYELDEAIRSWKPTAP